MSIGQPSRENEPSVFGPIFAGVMVVVGVGAAAWAAIEANRGKKRERLGAHAGTDMDAEPDSSS